MRKESANEEERTLDDDDDDEIDETDAPPAPFEIPTGFPPHCRGAADRGAARVQECRQRAARQQAHNPSITLPTLTAAAQWSLEKGIPATFFIYYRDY